MLVPTGPGPESLCGISGSLESGWIGFWRCRKYAQYVVYIFLVERDRIFSKGSVTPPKRLKHGNSRCPGLVRVKHGGRHYLYLRVTKVVLRMGLGDQGAARL